MKDLEHHQRIRPEQDYGTLSTITKVESMLNKLKEARVIDAEAERR
jgi:hypothetical protein